MHTAAHKVDVAGARMRPGRVYMMEFKVIFVIGNVFNRKDNGWKQLDLKKWDFRKRFRKQ